MRQWPTMQEIPDPPDEWPTEAAALWYEHCHQLQQRGQLCEVYLEEVRIYTFALYVYRVILRQPEPRHDTADGFYSILEDIAPAFGFTMPEAVHRQTDYACVCEKK